MAAIIADPPTSVSVPSDVSVVGVVPVPVPVVASDSHITIARDEVKTSVSHGHLTDATPKAAVFELAVYGVVRWDNHTKMEAVLRALTPVVNYSNVHKKPGDVYAIISFADAASKELSRAVLMDAKDAKGKKMFSKIIDAKERRNTNKSKKRKDTNTNTNTNTNNNNNSSKNDSNGSNGVASDESSSKRARVTSSDNKNDNNDNNDNDDITGEHKTAAAGKDGTSAITAATLVVANEVKSAADICTPLWRFPYEVQLKKKERRVVGVLKDALKKLKRAFPALTYPHEEKNKVCPLQGIVASPTIDGYRNKCEFTIGLDVHNVAVVGMTCGKFVDGITAVEAPDMCKNTPKVAIEAARLMTLFVKQSGLETWNRTKREGIWRMMKVRNSSAHGQLMIVLQIDRTKLNDEQLTKLKSDVTTHFTSACDEKWSNIDGNGNGHQLVGLMMQYNNGVSEVLPDTAPLDILFGSATMMDKIGDVSFRISPSSFFQVNNHGAKKLYEMAADWAECRPTTTLLDICCGTGTIGLMMASRVGKVIGLEMVSSAIDDAKENARINHINNTVYICGKAEDTLQPALDAHAITSDIVGIVDPPRAGLHPNVIKVLRRCEALKRVVYVSCNPKSLGENLHKFMCPISKTWRGTPFTAVRAVAMDMFPHTDHCEMIILLTR